MNILVNKAFLKELTRIPKKERQRVEKLVFEDVEKYYNLTQIPKICKLKGFSNYYKIRIGDYRIGLKYTDDTLVFERILHRKDIYKVYP